MKIITWFWKQTPNRAGYDAGKINRWAEMWRENLTLPHTLAVVTDHPEGIDPAIEIIPMPRDFYDVRCAAWSESSGLPQCYRRLALFSPDAAAMFGDTDLVSTDLDCLVVRNTDHLFAEPPEFRMFGGTSSVRPYNGSMVRIRAGARPQVYRQFAADPAGVAKRARALYIGSDQAVISTILGKGEKTWTERDGVHHFSPRFEREHGGLKGRNPPPGLCVLFFPGHVKPWDREAHVMPWIPQRWGKIKTDPTKQPPRLRAYRDPKGWGQAFAKAAAARGLFVSLFTRARMISTGVAFVRLDQQGPEREISRNMVRDLNRIGIRTLPTLREALWYDDKGAQLEALQPWMPPTRYFRESRAAEQWAKEHARFPFISKSIDGSASRGVRVINSLRDALFEVQRAFRAPGIPTVHGRTQMGYVYWQDLVPGNDCDYRVCIVGRFVYGLVRSVKPGTIMASGSGLFRNLTLDDTVDPRERLAAALAVEIADSIQTQWMAFDVVFTPEGKPLVLEMSSAWTMKAYETAPCFKRENLEPAGRTGADSFTIAVEVMERMACGELTK